MIESVQFTIEMPKCNKCFDFTCEICAKFLTDLNRQLESVEPIVLGQSTSVDELMSEIRDQTFNMYLLKWAMKKNKKYLSKFLESMSPKDRPETK